MTDIAASELVRRHFEALAEAAAVVGSVQIRNRATLAGNICNASPAADTAPPLLVYGAAVVAAGPMGTRRIPIDDFFVRSGVTTLAPNELVIAIEIPVPARRTGAVHLRRTRRRGHDLASVTLCCAWTTTGVTRLAYGSVGPRPVLAVDETGVLADAGARRGRGRRSSSGCSPTPALRSDRCGPAPSTGSRCSACSATRAVRTAIERLAARGGWRMSGMAMTLPSRSPSTGAGTARRRGRPATPCSTSCATTSR